MSGRPRRREPPGTGGSNPKTSHRHDSTDLRALELMLLGCIVQWGDDPSRLSGVRWSDTAHAEVYRACVRLAADGREIDTTALVGMGISPALVASVATLDHPGPDALDRGLIDAQRRAYVVHHGTELLAEWAGGNHRARDMLVGALTGTSTTTRQNSLEADLVNMADVTPRRVEWLYPGRIPRAKISMIVGAPAVGKSTLGQRIATDYTRGNVLILTSENEPAEVLAPRIEAHADDPGRYHVYPLALGLDDPTAQAEVRALVDRIRPELLIIDPVASFTGAANTHRHAELRSRVLDPLGALASETGCTVLLIAHTAKGSGDRTSVYAAEGSIGWATAARSILVAGEHGDDGGYALAHAKCSVGPLAPTVEYSLVGVETSAGPVGVVAWGDESDISADELVARKPQGQRKAAEREALEWLVGELEAGPVDADQIVARAQAENISKRTLDRAKKRAQVRSRRNGATWVWALDGQGGNDGQVH